MRGCLHDKSPVHLTEITIGHLTRAESVHWQERERNKAELTAAIAKHSQRAAAVEGELVALQQVHHVPQD